MNTELWAIGLVLASGMIGGMGPIYFQRGARIMNLRKPSTIYKNYYLIIGIFCIWFIYIVVHTCIKRRGT